MEEVQGLYKFISVWNWQIVSLIFMCSSFVLIAMPQGLKGDVLAITFFLLFVGCQFTTFSKKREFEEKFIGEEEDEE